MKMSNKKISLNLAVSILVLSPLSLLMRQLPVRADCSPFIPDALCPSNKPIPGSRRQGSPVQKGLTICNKTSVGNVYVAIALNYRGNFGSDGEGAQQHIESYGWWTIEPGACTKVYQNDPQRVTGYYAKGGNSVWMGSGSDRSYCINPSIKFQFKDSNAFREEKCQETGGQMVIFKPVRPSRQVYTLNLT